MHVSVLHQYLCERTRYLVPIKPSGSQQEHCVWGSTTKTFKQFVKKNQFDRYEHMHIDISTSKVSKEKRKQAQKNTNAKTEKLSLPSIPKV